MRSLKIAFIALLLIAAPIYVAAETEGAHDAAPVATAPVPASTSETPTVETAQPTAEHNVAPAGEGEKGQIESGSEHGELPPGATPPEGLHGEGAEGGHGGEGAEGGHDQSAAIKTLIFMIINFIIFVVILFVLLKKPLVNFIRERSVNIKKDLEDSAELLKKSEERNAKMQDRLGKLEAEVADLRDRLKKEGEAQGDMILEKSKQVIEHVRQDAKFQAEQQLKTAKLELQAEAARLAVKTAEEILKNSVGGEDHNKLVGQFLKEVNKP